MAAVPPKSTFVFALLASIAFVSVVADSTCPHTKAHGSPSPGLGLPQDSVLLQKEVRGKAKRRSPTGSLVPSLLSGAAFPFRAGIMHHEDAMADEALVESMARLGFPLQRPDVAAAEEVELPWRKPDARPLVACPGEEEERSAGARSVLGQADANLEEALATFCAAGLGRLAEFFPDGRFAEAQESLRGADGWVDKAFVSFMGLREAHDRIGAEMDLLIQSVHRFSSKPIVVANFGNFVPSSWTPERFPRLILMHARSAQALTERSFNFNKLTTMLFTKVKTGIALDADQWVNHGLDYLFERAEAETTKDYPYPIMPVHWMSRDPESSDMKGYPEFYSFRFAASDAPRRSMRWGHAHPTWAHHALPWLARWTSYALAPDKTHPPQWLRAQGWVEDEDLLNMALWAANATKQWCKYDTPSPHDFKTYLLQSVQVGAMLHPDSKWFPHGIAYVFFTAHDAKKPEESFKFLQRLWHVGDDHRRAIYYRGQWFGAGKALQTFDPSLKCMA